MVMKYNKDVSFDDVRAVFQRIHALEDRVKKLEKERDVDVVDEDNPPKFQAGDKIKFVEEKTYYTIRCCSERFLICTRPYNFQKTVFYAIVDLEEGVRGPNNLVFNMYDYKTNKGCKESLKALEEGQIEVSHRNRIPLKIEKVKKWEKKTKKKKKVANSSTKTKTQSARS